MKYVLPLLLCLVSTISSADEIQIRQALEEHYPMTEISSIRPSPIAGLYEVLSVDRIFYIDETGDYLLPGPLYETRTKTNLTQKRLDELLSINFDGLPFDKAIKVVKGSGARKMAVFSDPDCPFCRQLEKELAQLDNMTIYVFLNPITALHPEAMERATEIWCSADQARSWLTYMLERKKPGNTTKCDTPISEILALSEKIGLKGTPMLVFPNGKRVNGAIAATEIENLLTQGSSMEAQK